MSTADDKRALRAEMRARRSAIPEAERAAAAGRVAELAAERGAFRNRPVVSGYLPLAAELSPLPLLARARTAGCTVTVPVVRGRDRPLAFVAWTPETPLAWSAHGTQEPSDSAVELRPDLVLVPLLAFDAKGERLGFGGGYFDRTIAALRAAGRVTALGLAYAAQEIDEVPHETHDQRLDAVLTEQGITTFTDRPLFGA
jgi:5-formyltetrahydrofolate cyclo-ligase